jgi:hypothetical protein
VLLLIRKTSLAGALLTTFVMTNLLLYNLFYDVPVKLFAAHLILFTLFIILTDLVCDAPNHLTLTSGAAETSAASAKTQTGV